MSQPSSPTTATTPPVCNPLVPQAAGRPLPELERGHDPTRPPALAWTGTRRRAAPRPALDGLVRSALGALDPVIQCKGLHVDVRSARRYVELAGDEEQIAEAVIHLLHYAVLASPVDSRISVQVTERATGHPAVTVSQEGRPIGSEVLRRVFDPCFTTGPECDLRGLELSVARAIACTQGGDLKIVNDPEHGTRITIWFARHQRG